MRLHRNMPAGPDPCRNAVAPDRTDLVGGVEGVLTWYWWADLCARKGSPGVLGHARAMQALHGGKAQHEPIDSPQMAVLRRGGRLPPAYVEPADLRATRALLRRRVPRTRTRAARRAHVQPTTRQDNRPECRQQRAYQAQRDGVAARCLDPAVPQHVEVDLALIAYADPRRHEWR